MKKRKKRARIKGDSKRPRLSVFRSNKAIYAQIVDDSQGKTLAAANEKEVKVPSGQITKSEKAKLVGQLIAQKATKIKIKKVVFDRGKYHYQGRIKALASGAREGGLVF